MGYEYKMVQLARDISVAAGKEKGNEAAIYLQSIVDEQSKQGWEFYRVDTIGVVSKPGCLGSLFGVKETGISYYVATFRKQV